MWSEIGSKIGGRIMAGAMALSLGATLLMGIGAASADGGDAGSCVFNGTSYAAGTRLTVDDTTYICQDGQWAAASERVPSDPPAYDPPTTLTPLTGFKEEYHPVSHGNASRFTQDAIRVSPNHHFPF